MNHGCFVAWPLDADAVDDVRGSVREHLADAEPADANASLPDVDALTVSVLLRQPDGDRPQFAWFVEYAESESWADPVAAIREHSPLFSAVAPHLASGEPTVVAETAENATEFVHAAVPGRPTAFAARADSPPGICADGDSERKVADASRAPPPEVVPLVLRVRGGLGSLFARALAGLFDRTPAWVEAKFEAASLEVMKAEGMYTETLLLQRDDEGYAVWWYMESGGMEQVKDAYYESDSRIARLSEYVLDWVLERPERALVHPVEASEFELLAHGVDPGRD